MQMRRDLATLLLKIDLKNVVFINKANERFKYSK
jgi:hypothetical protein